MDRAALRLGARSGVRLRRLDPTETATLAEPRSALGAQLREILQAAPSEEQSQGSHLEHAIALVEAGVNEVDGLASALREIADRLGGIAGAENRLAKGETIPVAADSQIGRLLLAMQRHENLLADVRTEIGRLHGLV